MDFFKRRRFKFHVDFLLADLSDIPYVNAILFAKVRLLNGGSYSEESPRLGVESHHVCWGRLFQFTCRVGSNPNTGILEACLCRISVRKEANGGKSYDKLGFVDVNLSEYAGSGVDGITRSYILEGYHKSGSGKNRQDNSVLRVNISLVLQSADTCFKVPMPAHNQSFNFKSRENSSRASTDDMNPSERRADDTCSLHSGSSGFESLPRRTKFPIIGLPPHDSHLDEFIPGHSRNPSSASQASHISEYGSASGPTHSRQSSTESGQQTRMVTKIGDALGGPKAPPRHRAKLPTDPMGSLSSGRRMNSTRVDAGELIEELIKDHKLESLKEDRSENHGLDFNLLAREPLKDPAWTQA